MPVVSGVRVNTEVRAVQVALTDAGALAYLPAGAGALRTLVWVDQLGKEMSVGAPPRAYGNPRVSPDGSQIAVTMKDAGQDIHVWDVARRVLRRLTFDPSPNSVVTWIDNQRVAFAGVVDGMGQSFEQRADGLGTARQVTSGLSSFPLAASPDGTLLLVREYPPDGSWDIAVVPLQNPAARRTVERTPALENNPVLSPDRRWLAYQSQKTGRYEVYVRPFAPAGGGRFP